MDKKSQQKLITYTYSLLNDELDRMEQDFKLAKKNIVKYVTNLINDLVKEDEQKPNLQIQQQEIDNSEEQFNVKYGYTTPRKFPNQRTYTYKVNCPHHSEGK